MKKFDDRLIDEVLEHAEAQATRHEASTLGTRGAQRRFIQGRLAELIRRTHPGHGTDLCDACVGRMSKQLLPLPRTAFQVDDADLDALVVNRYPLPVAICYKHLLEDPDLGVVMDSFESIVHFLACVALSTYLRDLREGAWKANDEHPNGQRTGKHNRNLLHLLVGESKWGVGHYLHLLQSTIRPYESSPDRLPYPGIVETFQERGGHLRPTYQALRFLVDTRNNVWAHGSSRDRLTLRKWLDETTPHLRRLLSACAWLSQRTLILPLDPTTDNRIRRARLLVGASASEVRDVDLPVDPEERCLKDQLVLVEDASKRYWPLHPFGVFAMHRPCFLRVLQWAPQRHRIQHIEYVAYQSRERELRLNDPGDPRVQELAAQIEQLKRMIPDLPNLASPVNPDYRLPQVDMERVEHRGRFAGRERETQSLLQHLSKGDQEGRAILVHAAPGSGKSALLSHLADLLDARGTPTLLHFFKLHRSPIGFLQSLLWQAYEKLQDTPGHAGYEGDIGQLRTRLIELATRLAERFGQCVIILDGLEDLTEEKGAIDAIPYALPPGVSLILSARADLKVLAACSHIQRLTKWEMPPLDTGDISAFVTCRLGLDRASTLLSRVDAAELCRRSEGNPLVLGHSTDFLIDALERGEIPSLERLPQALKDIFSRLYDEAVEGAPLAATLLQALSIAQDGLTLAQLQPLLATDGTLATDLYPLLDKRLAHLLRLREGERYVLYHQGLGDFVRSNILGPLGEAQLHKRFCEWLNQPGQAMSGYRLGFQIYHLRRWAVTSDAGGQPRDAESARAAWRALLIDPHFVQSRVMVGQIFEHINEHAHWTTPDEEVEAWRRFLDRNAHQLLLDPKRFYQDLLNVPSSSPLAAAASVLKRTQGCFRWVNKPAEEEGASLVRTMAGHGARVTALAVDGDRLIASGSRLGDILIWRRATGEQDLRLLHGAPVSALTFCSGKVLSGGEDGSLALHNLETGQTRSLPSPHQGPLRALWSSGGICISCEENRYLALWDAERWELLGTWPHGDLNSKWRPGEGLLVTREGNDRLRVRNGTVTHWVPIGNRTAITRFGDVVLSAADRAVRMAEADEEDEAQAMPDGHMPSPVTAVGLAADGLLAAAGDRDGNLRIWTLNDLQPPQTVRAHRGGIGTVVVHGTEMVTASDDGSVRIWSLESPARTALPFNSSNSALGLAGSDRTVTVSTGGELRVWSVGDGTCLHEVQLHASSRSRDAQYCIASSPRHLRLAVASSNGTVWICTLDGTVSVSWEVGAGVLEIAFVDEDDVLVTADDEGRLTWWSVEDGALICQHQAHEGAANALAPLENGTVWSGGDDGRAAHWDKSGRLQVLEKHGDGVRQVFPSGTKVVTAGNDGLVICWDAESGDRITDIDAGFTFLRFCAVRARRRVCFATPGGNIMVYLGDDAAERTLAGHTRDVVCMDATPDGRVLVSGSLDGSVVAWNLHSGAQIARFEVEGSMHLRVVTRPGDPRVTVIVVEQSSSRLYVLELEIPLMSQEELPPVLLRVRKGPLARRVDWVRLDRPQTKMVKEMSRLGAVVLSGDAGSGKTLVLVRWAIEKAWTSRERILLTCFGLTLSRYLRYLVDSNLLPAEVRARISVLSFYEVCGAILGKHDIDHSAKGDVYYDNLRLDCLHALPALDDSERFDAIGVDEGQDLTEEMYAILRGALKIGSSEVKVVEDGLQVIFPRGGKRTTRQRLGMESRPKKLPAVYRSSSAILAYARRASGTGPTESPTDDQQPMLFSEKPPTEVVCTQEGLIQFLCTDLKRQIDEDVSPAEMAILYTHTLGANKRIEFLEPLLKRLAERNISHLLLSTDPEVKLTFAIEELKVKIGSVHAVKGLDFQIVYLIDSAWGPHDSPPDRGQQLFVGATRARDELIVLRPRGDEA